MEVSLLGYHISQQFKIVVLSQQHAVLQKISVVDACCLKSFTGEGMVAISRQIWNCSS